MSKYKELKRIAYEQNIALYKYGIVLFTFGNVSAINRDTGVIAIKPSGKPYEDMKPENMVIVDLDNNIVDGSLNPSTDTKTHIVLYKNFPEIGGIAHTHSTYAVAWAQSMKPIPVFGTTHADITCSDIPCTSEMSDEKIKGDYEEETGNLIVETFKTLSYKETGMVLVANHGPFSWGKTAEKAVQNSVMLEELAKTAFLTLHIDPDTPRLKKALIDKHYNRKHGEGAYYGQKRNK
ncbi:L-ribulose-5-phosphate 4-epimerase AraD [candidate division KSB1 bacterium]